MSQLKQVQSGVCAFFSTIPFFFLFFFFHFLEKTELSLTELFNINSKNLSCQNYWFVHLNLLLMAAIKYRGTSHLSQPAWVTQSDACPTGDKEVAGLIPPGPATFSHGD